MLCSQFYKLVDIVRLNFCLVGGFVAFYLTAFCTTVNYYISFFRVGDAAYRFHRSTALVGTVSGIYVYVKRPQAYGTMISGGVSQGLYFRSAMSTDEAVIVF